jgi:thioredoxin reductase
MDRFDVVIVGAGPAGLSAALFLGRCCRSVLLCDAGKPRNARSQRVNGFITRDGIDPQEFRRIGRQELERYPSIAIRDMAAIHAQRSDEGFEVTLADQSRVTARMLLLATGIVDELPPIEGLESIWGKSAFPCPYCDAFEVRGQRFAVYGQGGKAAALCRALTAWTDDIVLFTDGHALTEELPRITVIDERIRAIEGRDGMLERIALADGRAIARDVLFLSSPQHQRSPLAEALGVEIEHGIAKTGTRETTNVPGLFVAGDASDNVQFAIVAAAEGAEAAFEINRSLVREKFGTLR